jgi:hypothetical protein
MRKKKKMPAKILSRWIRVKGKQVRVIEIGKG